MNRYNVIFILIFIFTKISFADFYFSDNTKENKREERDIIENNFYLRSDYSIDANRAPSYFNMEGTNIINQNGVLQSDIVIEPPYKSNPFRYTEVTFMITAVLSYTYASFLVFGLDALENSTVMPSTSGRSRYKSLWISSTIFEITAGVFAGIAVAYDSYQRVYGNKKDGISFRVLPYYEPVNKDAGVMFSLTYPY